MITCFCLFSMNVGVAHSEVNPNTRVMNSRGIWLTYLLLTVVLHIILLSIPFFTVPLVWTLTNVIHNLVSYSWSCLLLSHRRHSCYLFHVCRLRTEWLLINAWQHCLPGLGVVVYLFVASPAGDVPVSAHSEGNSLWDSRPRQSTSAHTLGTDGLRHPVHVLPEVPHNLSNSSVSVLQVSITQVYITLRCYIDFLDKTALCGLDSGSFFLFVLNFNTVHLWWRVVHVMP